MKWSETVASKCRYGDIAGRIFCDADVIWEESEDDYSGHANVLAKMPDGTFVHYEWDYGSCLGCDDWENRGLTEEQVLDEMKRECAVFKDEQMINAYLLGAVNYSKSCEGIGTFESMGDAFAKWRHDRP